MRNLRFLSLLLTLSILSALTPSATAEAPLLISPAPSSHDWLIPQKRVWDGQLTDAADAWCGDAIKTVWETGLMEGRTSACFDFTSPLTNAQILVITARLHNLLNGGGGSLPAPEDGQLWYAPALDRLLTAELPHDDADFLLKQANRWKPEDATQPCIRRDFVYLLYAVLPTELPVLNPTAFAPDVMPESPVHRFYQSGILTGGDAYGTFGEEAALTRGAAAAILARLINPTLRKQFDLQSFDLCRDVLGLAPETVLFTVNGESVSAGRFAQQLCLSLYQWGRNSTADAISAAMRHWCDYKLAVHVLAAEKGVALTAKQLAEAEAYGQKMAELNGLSHDYYRFSHETIALNLALDTLYTAENEKTGQTDYHKDLESTARQLTPQPTDALLSIDPLTVYDRLASSPYPRWELGSIT